MLEFVEINTKCKTNKARMATRSEQREYIQIVFFFFLLNNNNNKRRALVFFAEWRALVIAWQGEKCINIRSIS